MTNKHLFLLKKKIYIIIIDPVCTQQGTQYTYFLKSTYYVIANKIDYCKYTIII